jgi:hypothetical protein
MRKLLSLGLLSVLAISLFASTCLISIASPEKWGEKYFWWDVYLYFPAPGPPVPYRMESSLWWADGWLEYIVTSTDLYVYDKVAGDRYFFYRAVRDELDFDGDGVVDGAFTIEMVIIWEWPVELIPGEESVGGKFKLYDGTGYFEGMKAHGSVLVEVASDPDYGLILIQHQEGIIQSVGP